MSITRIPGSDASPDDVSGSEPRSERLDDDNPDATRAARDLAQAKADLDAQVERMQVQALDTLRPTLAQAAVDVGVKGIDGALGAAADRAGWATERLAEASRLVFDGVAAEVRAADVRAEWTVVSALRPADDDAARVGEASAKIAADVAARAASDAASSAGSSRDDDAERRREQEQV
jgi:hypothetical protein